MDQELANAAVHAQSARTKQRLCVHSPGGSTFLFEMMLSRHLECMTSNQKSDSTIDAYLLEEQLC